MKKIFLICILSLLGISLFGQHMLYVGVQNSNGNTPTVEDITFTAYVTSRPTEILTEMSTGCGWNQPIGMVEVQCATFPTNWAIGDIVHLEVTETSSGETGVGDYDLVGGSYSYYPGPLILAGTVTNPIPAENPTPADAATDVAIDAVLSWQYSGAVAPDGYKLYLGTDNPPTNIVNGDDLGVVLTFDPEDFVYNTTYYWQIVPFTNDDIRSASKKRSTRTKNTENSRGNATDCPIWEFLTEDAPAPPPTDLFISEVADPGDSYQSRFVELYNNGDAIDFDSGIYYLSKQANGGTSWNDNLLTGTIASNSTFCIADNATAFQTSYGFAPDQDGTINGNGDDGYFLYFGGDHSTGTLIDAYGVIDEDGTGKDWEYLDAVAYRNNDITAPNTTWTASEWTIIDPGNVADATPGTHQIGGPTPISITSISREYTVPTAAQTCDVQCDITGGTAPYTAVIKYDVNGTAQADIPMTNSTGDTYVGTIPAQTDGDRVEYYIQVTDSAARAVETSSTYGLFWGISPISNAAGNIKEVDVDGNMLYEGYYSTVTGIASVATGIFSGSNLEVYVEDTNGGINVFKYGDDATTIVEGNSYTITGMIDFYNGKSEIIPDDPATDIVDNGFVNLIDPLIITIADLLLAPEDYENTLVGIQHVNKDAGTWGANENLDISDGTGSMVLRVDGDTDLDDNPEPAWPKDVIGIFSQYDSSSPYDGGYQLLPRSTADIHDDGSLLAPNLATLVAPVDGGVVPLGNLVLDWDYTGPAVTGFEVWLGYTGSAAFVTDVTDTEHTVPLAQYNTPYDWFVKPYIETGTTGRSKNVVKNNLPSNRELRDRIYPGDTPVIWTFSTFDQGPPPANPIPNTGGTTNINGGTTGNGGSGAGSSVTMTPTGTAPTAPINVQQVAPETTGVPFPDNALDIAFTIETIGTITDPITIKIEWDYPVPTPPTSGAPELVVNHGSGWVAHVVDNWDYSAAPYWIEFTTDQLSDWVIGDGDESSLPVTLTEFTGICYEGIPHINWTTQSENENQGWNVYRSEIENGWEQEDVTLCNPEMIRGQGTTSTVTNYTYQDIYDLVENTTYYYWLQSISISGNVEIYGPVSVLVETQEEPPVVPNLPESTLLNSNYPNPFNPSTTIDFDIKEGEAGRLTIFNVRGQIVLEKDFAAGSHTFNWNAAKQASGVYFYTLKTASYYKTKKMILMK